MDLIISTRIQPRAFSASPREATGARRFEQRFPISSYFARLKQSSRPRLDPFIPVVDLIARLGPR
jgi:hypothetical protein